MTSILSIWPTGWSRQQRSTATIVTACVALVIFLWSLAKLLSQLPEPIGPDAHQFAEGAQITIWLTILSGVSGIFIGVLAAVAKLAKFAPVRWIADLYVWVIRGTPLVVQIFFVWALAFLAPALKLSEFSAAAVALALNAGAYNAEAIRAGILAVPKGQTEAARSLGLSPFRTFVDIIFPQSFKIALPPLVNNVVALLKDSSLAYVIGVVELAIVGGRVSTASFRPIPVWMTTASIYLILTTALTQISGAIEARLDIEQRR